MGDYLHFPNNGGRRSKKKEKEEMVRGQASKKESKYDGRRFVAAIRAGFGGFREPSDNGCRGWAGVERPTRALLASCARSDSR